MPVALVTQQGKECKQGKDGKHGKEGKHSKLVYTSITAPQGLSPSPLRGGSKQKHLGGEVAEGNALVDLVHVDMANTLIHVHQQPHSVVVSKGRPSRPPVCLAVHASRVSGVAFVGCGGWGTSETSLLSNK